MTRGFVTIATGSDRYYRLATNLLHSYRLFSSDPMPFALICDRINDYTREFDDLVLLDSPFRSYVDKLYLPKYAPYDETIFIDADSLAYRDLNGFWDAFEHGSVFSVFGNDYPTDYPYAWFKPEDTGQFADTIRSIPDFVGGVYYMRKTPDLEAFAETSWYIMKNYHCYKFRQFEDPSDETIFALAMSVHGYTTAGESSLPVCFYPHCNKFKADLTTGSVCYDNRYHPEKGLLYDAFMVHWGSGITKRPVYCLEEFKLNQLMKGKKPSRISVFLASAGIWLRYQAGRAFRLAKRLLNICR